jgi:hypothetical protein
MSAGVTGKSHCHPLAGLGQVYSIASHLTRLFLAGSGNKSGEARKERWVEGTFLGNWNCTLAQASSRTRDRETGKRGAARQRIREEILAA